jgi:hypothetical protein
VVAPGDGNWLLCTLAALVSRTESHED